MSTVLPPTIAIKTQGVYMNYNDDSDSQTQGFIKFNGGNVFSPLAKFEVVNANTGIGMVHIRCSHNKKFLRVRSQASPYISPDADEPEEDQSKWSCTLFQPRPVDSNPDRVWLFHVQRQLYSVAYKWFWVGTNNPGQENIVEIIDLQSLVILPRHVSFKGDNGKYLCVGDSFLTLRFDSTEKGTANTWFEVFTDGHGRAQIKSYKNQTFISFLLWASIGMHHPDYSTFWPVKVDKNVVALRSCANNNFCGPDENGYLVFAHLTISKKSLLVLEELVLSRRIYNAVFDLANAVIYGETPITMATANGSNNTPEKNIIEFKFTYTESKSSTWTSSHSWMAGMKVEAELKTPHFAGGKVEVYGEYSGSYQWGETSTCQNTLETTYTAVVQANTSISMSLMATKGSYDVPYSYYQRDVLYNGKAVVYKKDDGLYTGVNSYNFRYEVVQTSTVPPGTKGRTIITKDMQDEMLFVSGIPFFIKFILLVCSAYIIRLYYGKIKGVACD